MSAHYDYARPAKQVYPVDTSRLHMASQTASYLPSLPPQSSSSRRMPGGGSASLPQSSTWLSDVGDFNSDLLSHSYLVSDISAPRGDTLLSPDSASELGYYSRTLPRARSRDQLSTSSNAPPISISSNSRSQSRHTPSPVPSPSSRTLHPSRSFTATSPHKTSGIGLDRDASGHLDMKRLMSKPAKQTTSGSMSLPSDSERSADASSSRFNSSRRPSELSSSRPPLSRSANASREREKMSLHVNTTGLRSSSAPRPGYTSSSPERKPAASDGQMGKPSRNVLRRRPSARSNPTTPPTAIMHTRAATDDINLSRSGSAIVAPQRPVLPVDAPIADHGLPFTQSSSAARSASSSRTKSSLNPPRSAPVPAALTPAGAVALAYKQQTQRREELAETASFNEGLRAPPAGPAPSPARRRAATDPTDDGEEEGGEPYYTVFGSTTGKLVAVGSPEDDDWHFTGFDTRASVPVHAKPTGSRSLSRKMSGSIKRVAGSMKRERDHRELVEPGRDQWKPYDGSHGVQGRHSPLQPLPQAPNKTPQKPITLDTTVGGRSSPRESPTTKPSPTKNSASPQDDGRMSRASRSNGKDREDVSSPGTMWSKLMKRISTGGLREKYQQNPAPPPVPALPQHLPLTAASRATMDITSGSARRDEVSENGVLLRRFMQSRASMSGVRPSSSPKAASLGSSSRPSTSTGTARRPSTGNTQKSRASMSGQRPATATATRSSSPGSLEAPPSNFFTNHNHTSSTRSSFSSLGEEIPPVPKKNVGQYIISPSELSRMAKTSTGEVPAQTNPDTRTRGPNRAQTVPPDQTAVKETSSPEDRPVQSLPLPPRRAATLGNAPSPLAPSFSVEDTINDLMPPQPAGPPPLIEFGASEPPPRPKRSSRRALPQVEVPTRSQSLSASAAMPRSPATPRGPPQVRVNVDLIRSPSSGALSRASTAKQVLNSSSSSNSPASALSGSASPSSAVSQKHSPLTFREMESPRHRLTEKEKADKWEDLLERSARAGGTLHISDKPLLSDHNDIDGDDSFFNAFDSD